MGVRILEGRADVPINIRVSGAMKAAMDSAADDLRISTAQYIRLAVQEKLDRDSGSSSAGIDRDVLRAVIREELEKIEKEEAGSGPL